MVVLRALCVHCSARGVGAHTARRVEEQDDPELVMRLHEPEPPSVRGIDRAHITARPIIGRTHMTAFSGEERVLHLCFISVIFHCSYIVIRSGSSDLEWLPR
ncbi:hypothetical protein BKA93DRAFT_2336 [Sparassis latifolia]